MESSGLDSTTFWLAMALVLIIEGFMPFVSPATWRKTFQQILQFGDGQLRFFGLCSLLLGVVLIWWLA
ncbi:hypothetical protein GALL_452680 [mine drainage metagenome]|uniref:DUF2065 domain-containing protein n=1 Tax=mine drainage metagenome TaxID=410659 RepID=A0A1J5PPM0_9ZZZZ